MRDVRARYLSDPIFRTVVEHLRNVVRMAILTPSEIREAAMVACILEEEYKPAAPFSTSDAELERLRIELLHSPNHPTIHPPKDGNQ